MNLNKAFIIGNLTQNPEVKNTPSGQSVASFTIATNRVWTDPSGQKQEKAEFHNMVAWGKLADVVGQYLAKGRLCMAEGRIQTRNWDDQAGVRHWKTEIIVENIQLGPRPANAGGNDYASGNSYGGNQNNNQGGSNFSQPRSQTPAEPVETADSSEEIKIEDIPF